MYHYYPTWLSKTLCKCNEKLASNVWIVLFTLAHLHFSGNTHSHILNLRGCNSRGGLVKFVLIHKGEVIFNETLRKREHIKMKWVLKIDLILGRRQYMWLVLRSLWRFKNHLVFCSQFFSQLANIRSMTNTPSTNVTKISFWKFNWLEYTVHYKNNENIPKII